MTKRIITPFAASGDKNTVPDTAPVTDDGYANYPDGFPPSNSVDPALGGYYVKRADFNGVLNDVTTILRDLAKGLLYTYDATYSTAISGYPANALVSSLTGGLWLNVLGSANTSDPDTGGAGWLLINPTKQVPTGTVFPYASGIAAPTGYVFTNGAALSRTTYADLFKLIVTDQGYTAQTFTCTIANPAVFTKTAHGFTNGERLRLSTTGALPTGLNTTADYFVEKLTNDTFYLTTSVFGIATRVITTGTQSGTHSYLQSLYGLGDGSTTFNAPDTRGLFIRGLDAGRGIDANRTIGTTQKGTLQVLDTNTGIGADGVWSLSTSLSTTLAQSQNSMGVDGYTLTDYPFINIGGIAPTSTQSLPGLFGTQCSTGIGRPSNIAMPHIIKY